MAKENPDFLKALIATVDHQHLDRLAKTIQTHQNRPRRALALKDKQFVKR